MSNIDKIIEQFFSGANKFLPSGTAIKPIAPDELRAICQEVHDAAVAECGNGTDKNEIEALRAELEVCAKQLWARSGNYIANDETKPTAIYFRNGRVVSVVDGVLGVSTTNIFPEFDHRNFAKEAWDRQEMRKALYAAIAAEGK